MREGAGVISLNAQIFFFPEQEFASVMSNSYCLSFLMQPLFID